MHGSLRGLLAITKAVAAAEVRATVAEAVAAAKILAVVTPAIVGGLRVVVGVDCGVCVAGATGQVRNLPASARRRQSALLAAEFPSLLPSTLSSPSTGHDQSDSPLRAFSAQHLQRRGPRGTLRHVAARKGESRFSLFVEHFTSSQAPHALVKVGGVDRGTVAADVGGGRGRGRLAALVALALGGLGVAAGADLVWRQRAAHLQQAPQRRRIPSISSVNKNCTTLRSRLQQGRGSACKAPALLAAACLT